MMASELKYGNQATTKLESGIIDQDSASQEKPVEYASTALPETNLDKGIIGWDGQDDPDMPLNWTKSKKWTSALLLSLMTLMTPLSSSILAPSIASVSKEFAPSLESLIAFRFLAGVGGSAVMTLGGGSISDVFHREERGLGLAIWSIGIVIGPSLGPLIGAFVAETIGWRWNGWIVLIPSAVVAVLMAIFCPESHHKVLMQRKVARMKQTLGREDLLSCYAISEAAPSQSQVLINGMMRPLKMMTLSPIVVSLSFHASFLYGTLYLLFNTISAVFRGKYGWSLGRSGLAYIPLGLGFIFGLALFAKTSDRTIVRLTQQNGGVFLPEMRLANSMWYACLVPSSFFWYGWTVQYKVHWIVPLLGLFPFAVGIVGVWQCYQAYLVDAFGSQYAASALAAFTVLRSVVAAFLPLAGPSMFKELGLGWGCSLLGFITVAMIPIPALVERKGAWLRSKYILS
ncbi:hypothetical protein NQ176_g1429 [Zarea fungicola]|uniref:Uncharacterized protein n=1 Tax=Zarea fungicola TaxID=93591 RepID=A0ACC1NTY9_9HYPO|nr:hypothetical protein NQ176_g1429 [Lecanicillium fungicola]